MPIDLQSSVSSCSRYAFGSNVLNGILGSSLFVAILISIMMMLIVMIFYPAKQGTGFGTIAKMGLYMFFTTLLIVFLHDSVLKYVFEEESTVSSNDDFMRGVNLSGKNPVYSYESVKPTLDEVEDARPREPKIVITDSDDSEKSPITGSSEPTYGGSIIDSSVHGTLGGSHAPESAGNPYA